MLKRFKIVNQSNPKEINAILIYNTETDKYTISIPRNISQSNLPAILKLLYNKGQFEIDDTWSRKFISERVVPADRQNIGKIMRKVGMKRYDEINFLEYNAGKSCMDDFYLEQL